MRGDQGHTTPGRGLGARRAAAGGLRGHPAPTAAIRAGHIVSPTLANAAAPVTPQAARPAEPASYARDQQWGEAPGPAASPAGDAPAAAQALPPPLKREQQQQQQGSSSRGVNSPLPRLPPLRVDSEQTATASWRCSDASAQVQGSTAAGGMSEAARLAIEVAATGVCLQAPALHHQRMHAAPLALHLLQRLNELLNWRVLSARVHKMQPHLLALPPSPGV